VTPHQIENFLRKISADSRRIREIVMVLETQRLNEREIRMALADITSLAGAVSTNTTLVGQAVSGLQAGSGDTAATVAAVAAATSQITANNTALQTAEVPLAPVATP
jgi:K+/H+ antiporter YhaU regulatory subunit KhtT